MKKSTFKKILCMLSFAVVPALFFGSTVNENMGPLTPLHKIGDDEITGVETDPKQYVGYGYNVISGKALYEADALMLNNPILDVDNPELQSAIKVFDGSKTEYQSSSSTSVREISKRYGTVLSGGGGIGGGIASFSVDIGAKFNRSKTESWTGVASEEYSYYTIFSGNRPVILQKDFSELNNYFAPQFKKDLLACKHAYDAQHLFNKYGTHLLTGYTLGGIFEMTNYYATNSNNYVKEGDTSFDAQVNIALGSFANGNLEFSFTNNYGYLNNNKFATNQYKCTTYGGLAFPGLTIDQAFSWYETIAGAGYVYQLWTDSINAGRNLVIVNIPQSSRMVPLWDLLPNTSEYAEAKYAMMNEYQELTKGKYIDYKDKYPDRFKSNLGNDRYVETNFDFEDYGFNYSTTNDKKYVTSHIDGKAISAAESYNIQENSMIYMDYDQTKYIGQEAHWEVSGSKNVTVKDKINGIFEIGELGLDASGIKHPESFTASFYVNNIKLFQRRFLITDNAFAGGDGSEKSPYLISNAQQYKRFAENEKFWQEDQHFKLTNDIDLTGYTVGDVGDATNRIKFLGTFDGNHYTIKGYTDSNPSDSSFGLFYANAGTIKNLNVDYSNKQILLDYFVSCGGLIAGRNNDNGVISNCSVRNANVVYVGDKKNDDNAITLGAITGYNNATIEGCEVNNVSFDIKVSNLRIVQCGLITASSKDNKNNGINSNVEKCSVSNSNIKVDVSSASIDTQVSVGGICGFAEYTNFNNCIVKNMKTTDENKLNLSVVKNTNDKASYCVGGLVGNASYACKIDNSIVLGTFKITGILDKIVGNNLAQTWAGLFIGRTAEDDPDAKVKITNSYAQYGTGQDHIICGHVANDVVGHGYDLKAKTTFNKNDYSGNIGSDTTTWVFNKNEPCLNLSRINVSSLTLDVSKTKQKFFVGEEFSYNNIAVKGLYTTGEEFSDSTVTVDSSNFYDGLNPSEPAQIGTKYIEVVAYGQRLTYSVEVVPLTGDHIYVEKNPAVTKEHYTHTSEFHTDTVNVIKVNSNGSEEILNYDETGENGYTYKIPGGEFVAGNNTITISYKDFEYQWNLDAIERDIKEIQVSNKVELSKQEYKVGDDNLDLSMVKARILYQNGDERDIQGKDCEFIHSRIQQGENKIIATYEVEYKDEFTVKGVTSVDKVLLDAFISAVNKIDSADPLAKRFKDISEANRLYQQIGSEYEGDATYQAAKAKLLSEIDNYNETIDQINNGFENSIVISGSMNETLLSVAGFTLLSGLISLIIKLF